MPTPPLNIELFNHLCIQPTGQSPLEYAPQPTGVLLAYLALHRDRPVNREEIIALIWPDSDEETGRHRLRQSLYALRRQLEPFAEPKTDLLLTTKTTLQLHPTLVQTDVGAFEAAVQLGEQSTDLTAKELHLSEAVRLYRGALLPGFFQDCFLAERNRLERVLRQVLRTLTHLSEQQGDYLQGVEIAQRALALDPLAEEVYVDLMRLYGAMGQPANVLYQYQALEQMLAREFGEQPSEQVRTLLQSLRQKGPAVLPPPPVAIHERETQEKRETAPNTPRKPPNRPEPPPPSQRPIVFPWRWVTVLGLLLVSGSVLWKGRSRPSAPPTLPPVAENPLVASNPMEVRMPILPPTWVKTYQKEPGEKDSEPTAITTDRFGTIFITGFVHTKTDADFLTLHFDQDGRQRWAKHYNGPGNDVDRARAIVVDDASNSYIVGESDNGIGNDTTRLSGLDFTLIKYSPAGDELWVERYNGEDNGEDSPVQLLLHPQGGLYVLGHSWSHKGDPKHGGSDIVLLKYRETGGKPEWVTRYNEEPHQQDQARAMVRDPDGSLYVTGTSRVEAPGGGEEDYLTIKFSPQGKPLWARRYGKGNHADDRAKAIGLDGAGNVYVVGEGLGPPGTLDATKRGCITVKYSPQGEQMWVHGTRQESDRISWVTAATIAGNGKAFITGQAQNEKGRLVFRTIVREPDGTLEWATSLHSVNTNSPYPTDAPAVLLLSQGITLVGSIFAGTPSPAFPLKTERDIITIHYDSTGKLSWIGQYDTKQWADYGYGVALDAESNLIVTGQADNGKGKDIVVLKYPELLSH